MRLKCLFLIIVLSFLLIDCSRSPKKAREQLVMLRVSYDESTFLKKAGAGEKFYVKLFIESGINLNARTYPENENNEYSALELASKNNKIDIVELLIEKGADVLNNNALYYAKQNGYIEIVQLLEKAGAKIGSSHTDADGYEYITFSNESGKFGYKDKGGKIVIEPQFIDAQPFKDGLARVNIGGQTTQFDTYGGKWGYIDPTGKMVIPLQFNFASDFFDGLAAVNIGGKEVPQSDDEGLEAGIAYIGGWDFIDKSGRFISEQKYDQVENFSKGIAKVTINKETKYIDKTGKMVENPNPPGDSIIGTWEGTYSERKFIIRITKQEKNNLWGENTVYWNKPVSREVTGTINGNAIILNEPGTDKGDGSFVGTISDDKLQINGTWKRFSGGVEKKWSVSKK